uniref:Uncharacterized protein n=1 Tax=Oryza glumipatula TaxID=40148 RepID=A0A0E0AZK5_9ORYZ
MATVKQRWASMIVGRHRVCWLPDPETDDRMDEMQMEMEAQAQAHVLLFPWPQQGHINPMLHLASALLDAGLHEVTLTLPGKIWFQTRGMEATTAAIGVTAVRRPESSSAASYVVSESPRARKSFPQGKGAKWCGGFFNRVWPKVGSHGVGNLGSHGGGNLDSTAQAHHCRSGGSSIRKKKMKHVERTILPVVAFVGYILAHEETRTRGRHEVEHGFLAHPAARLPGPA